ncbi:MAG: TSUP family transporter [Streptosporangiales bacterium]|nr:TSUP family transporter [Streptosporangiales bacterium]
MELTPYLLASLALAAGSCLQCSLGFGLGLLCAPLLALLDPDLVPGPLLLIAVVLTSVLAFAGRRSLEFRELGWAMVSRVPGTVLGVTILIVLPTRGLEAFFGVTVLVAVLLSVLGLRPVISRPTLIGAGAVSGVMGTAVSTGAAPVAWLMQSWHGEGLRANLSTFFFAGTALSVAGLAVTGQIGTAEVRTAALLLPGIAVGALASRWAVRVLDPRRTRVAVLVISGLASVALLVRAILG